MTKWIRWAAAAGLGLALAACVPEFETALEGGSPADPALIGTWSAKATGEDTATLLDIAVKGDGISLVMSDPKGDEQKIAFSGKTAEIGGVHYLSVTPDDADALGAGGAKIGFMIFRYAPDSDGFKVWALDGEAVAKAINDGKLKGTVTGSGTDRSPRVTSSAAEVAVWIATADGQAAFKATDPSDILILTRATP